MSSVESEGIAEIEESTTMVIIIRNIILVKVIGKIRKEMVKGGNDDTRKTRPEQTLRN